MMKSMKLIRTLAIGIFSLLLTISVSAQNPPDPPDEHGDPDDQPPGGTAPVGSGAFILLGLGAVYGGRKVYLLRKPEE